MFKIGVSRNTEYIIALDFCKLLIQGQVNCGVNPLMINWKDSALSLATAYLRIFTHICMCLYSASINLHQVLHAVPYLPSETTMQF